MDSDVLRERELEEQRQLARWQQALTALHATDPNEHLQVMSSTAALLPLNPDYYHAWNMRKRSIKSNLTRLDLKEELAFNVDCIKANPKSYYSWYHRRWLLTLLFPEPEDAKHPTADLINHELHLCQLLLDLDKRNCIS